MCIYENAMPGCFFLKLRRIGLFFLAQKNYKGFLVFAVYEVVIFFPRKNGIRFCTFLQVFDISILEFKNPREFVQQNKLLDLKTRFCCHCKNEQK